MGLRRWRLGVAALGALVVACHGQPRPTYEYGETETYTSTADDQTPHRVPPPGREVESDAAAAAPAASSPASDPAAPAPDPAAAREPTPPPAAEEPAPAPGRWYKAKPW